MNKTNELKIPDCLKDSEMMADYAQCLVEKLPLEYRQSALDKVEASYFDGQATVTDNPIGYLKFVVKRVERTIQDEIESAQGYFEDYPDLRHLLSMQGDIVSEYKSIKKLFRKLAAHEQKPFLDMVDSYCAKVRMGSKPPITSITGLMSHAIDVIRKGSLDGFILSPPNEVTS